MLLTWGAISTVRTRNEIGVKSMNSTRLTWQMLGKRILAARKAENNSLEWYINTHPERYAPPPLFEDQDVVRSNPRGSGGGGDVDVASSARDASSTRVPGEGALSEVWQGMLSATGSVIDGARAAWEGDEEEQGGGGDHESGGLGVDGDGAEAELDQIGAAGGSIAEVAEAELELERSGADGSQNAGGGGEEAGEGSSEEGRRRVR